MDLTPYLNLYNYMNVYLSLNLSPDVERSYDL